MRIKLQQTLWLYFLCVIFCSCVTLNKSDSFPVGSSHVSLDSLQALLEPGSTIGLLGTSLKEVKVLAYYIQHPGSRGVLIFYGGSGNELVAPIKVLSKRTLNLGLDLVVSSYYQQGEAIPSVTEVRAKTQAVYNAVIASHLPASKAVYLAGYSLGAWFALDISSHNKTEGIILVGAETTPAEVIHKTYLPWSYFFSVNTDADEKQLDASLYASKITTKTLVVTSSQDKDVPASISRKLFGLLPSQIPKKILVLSKVTHGRYFLSDKLWSTLSDYFRLTQGSGNDGK